MLKSVITRVQEVAAFKFVGGAANIPTAQDATILDPAAYVIPISERAEESSLITALSQRVNIEFGVLIAMRNVADNRGEASVQDLSDLRTELKQQLLNWQPEAYDPVVFVAGNVMGIDDYGVLWWLDTFKTSYLERVM